MARPRKPKVLSTDKLVGESDELLRHADRVIAEANEAIGEARKLLSRSSITMLRTLLFDHRHSLGSDTLYNVVLRNIKALQDEMSRGVEIDPAVIARIEGSIKRLAATYGKDTPPERRRSAAP